MAPFRLDGKTAIVTGGASGIGRVTADLFANVGAAVVIADIDGAAAAAAAAAIGPGAIGLACDVSGQAAVDTLFAAALDRFGGRLDVLVNNAAYRAKADTMTMPAAEWDIMHAVIARGTFLCMREAIRIMRVGGGGAIVNVSSISALHPTIFANMHYDSAKAGVDAMTRAAAMEFAAHNIRVNSVQPGGTDTTGGQAVSTPRGPITAPGRIPLARLSQPIEQARAILFLASDAASYITGHQLSVDGGFRVS